MSLVFFDLSFVTVKQPYIISQIVHCLVILSLSVLLESINESFDCMVAVS